MTSITYLFEEGLNMDQYFSLRTNYHINLVKKYLDKIITLQDINLDKSLIEKEKEIHDKTKFQDPEYEPYVQITWKYHMKDLGKEYKTSDDIEKKMQEATFHHVKNNSHHPEYWDNNSTINSINGKDRDQLPAQMVDATKMPNLNISFMVADWCAMSQEKGNSPIDWAKMNINKRWIFNSKQEKFIYDLIDKIWK